MPLDQRSRDNLRGVHADLVRVMEAAAEAPPIPFTIIEGLRTQKRQRQLVEQGASRTMNSRHLTGHAVDLVPDDNPEKTGLQIDWNDWDAFERLAKHIKATANHLGVALVWGGDWSSFRDGPHYELERHSYPATGDTPAEKRRDTATKTGAAIGAGSIATWAATNPEQAASAGSGLLNAAAGLDPTVQLGALALVGAVVAVLIWWRLK